MLDLELMDKQRLLKNYNMNYEMLTKYSDNVEGIDKAYEYGSYCDGRAYCCLELILKSEK